MYVNESTSEALKSLLLHIDLVNTTNLAWYLADIHSTSTDNSAQASDEKYRFDVCAVGLYHCNRA